MTFEITALGQLTVPSWWGSHGSRTWRELTHCILSQEEVGNEYILTAQIPSPRFYATQIPQQEMISRTGGGFFHTN